MDNRTLSKSSHFVDNLVIDFVIDFVLKQRTLPRNYKPILERLVMQGKLEEREAARSIGLPRFWVGKR